MIIGRDLLRDYGSSLWWRVPLSADRPHVLVKEILSAVRDSSGPAEQVDDVTLLVIQAERSQR